MCRDTRVEIFLGAHTSEASVHFVVLAARLKTICETIGAKLGWGETQGEDGEECSAQGRALIGGLQMMEGRIVADRTFLVS